MREIDRLTTERSGITSLTLMENAAIAAARCVTELVGNISGKSILIFCGKGNNGGDGAAAARLLAIAGARVDVVLIGKVDDTRGDARENFERLRAWNSHQDEIGLLNLFECESEKGWQQLLESVLPMPHEAIVDALFGTGLTRPVEGIHREAVAYVNRQRARRDLSPAVVTPIISIDIPSGLDADSEQPIGEAVMADATVTMTAPKRANVIPPASDYNGRLIVADIGSPAELIAESESQLLLTTADDARRWLVKMHAGAGASLWEAWEVEEAPGLCRHGPAAELRSTKFSTSDAAAVRPPNALNPVCVQKFLGDKLFHKDFRRINLPSLVRAGQCQRPKN